MFKIFTLTHNSAWEKNIQDIKSSGDSNVLLSRSLWNEMSTDRTLPRNNFTIDTCVKVSKKIRTLAHFSSQFVDFGLPLSICDLESHPMVSSTHTMAVICHSYPALKENILQETNADKIWPLMACYWYYQEQSHIFFFFNKIIIVLHIYLTNLKGGNCLAHCACELWRVWRQRRMSGLQFGRRTRETV